MRGCALDATTGGRDKALDSRRIQTSCEFLFIGFDSGDDGHGEEVFEYAAVEIEDVADFLVGFGLCEKCGVAFLPEELARA
jgi:hypothetical protein